MNDVLRWEVEARSEPTVSNCDWGVLLLACCGQQRARCCEHCAAHSITATEIRVGRVDNGVDGERRNVSVHELHFGVELQCRQCRNGWAATVSIANAASAASAAKGCLERREVVRSVARVEDGEGDLVEVLRSCFELHPVAPRHRLHGVHERPTAEGG